VFENRGLKYLANIKDKVGNFDELSCGSADSSLGRFSGFEIMNILKKLKNKVELLLKKNI
jgi:2,3-bisphosphoglycerate-independent phosphoglycerate mutase